MTSFEAELDELRSRALLRKLREIEGAPQPEMAFAGRRLVNFAANDYLGLAMEPALRDAAKDAIDEYGVGAAASRLICGNLAPHVLLERKIAEWKGAEAALTFTSGYAASVGTLGALLRRDDVVILDKLSHASLVDGARISGAQIRVFPHNHLGKLESHLQWARDQHPEGRVIIVTESVFSMDGDWCPLRELVEIKNRYGAMLMVDEAHAVGVIGANGRGLAHHLGLAREIDIQMGTLSKALGCAGGYVCGSRSLIDLLINRARSFVYSTAPAPAIAAAATAAIGFLQTPAGERRRQELRARLGLFAERMPELFPDGRKVQSAIFPVILGTAERAIEASHALAEAGYFVPAIRYPTVARDRARLRITLSARHTPEQIAGLCRELRRSVAVAPLPGESGEDD